MELTVNGDKILIQNDSTITDLLTQLNLTNKRIAVEKNQSIIPRSQHSKTTLKENDAIEIIHAIGGG